MKPSLAFDEADRAMQHKFRDFIHEKVGHFRLFQDKVFLQEDWARQKSWRRFLPHPIVSLRVLWGFSWVVVFVTLVAVCICLYHDWLESIGAPKFWDHADNLWIPWNLSSFALALLLVHRTTAAYNRWWEARTVWGGVLNVARNIVRIAGSSWGFPSQEQALLEMLGRFVIAMPYCLKAHIAKVSPREELESILPAKELEFLMASREPCQRCVQVCTSIVGNAMPGAEFLQTRTTIDEQLALYTNYVGACERIYKTPIPIAFTRHLTRFLLVWLSFLPWALWPIVGWATPGVEFILAFLLIGTENIGVQVEEPFCIMTVDAFCTGIEATVTEILDGCQGVNGLVKAIQAADICLGYTRGEAVHGAEVDFVVPPPGTPRRFSKDCNGSDRLDPVQEHDTAFRISMPSHSFLQ